MLKPIFLIDMDGTLYRGNSPIEYAKEFITFLRRNNLQFVLLTNCPGSSANELTSKLTSMSIDVANENILTSGQITASCLAADGQVETVYLLGSEALNRELEKAGLKIVETNPDCVVVGFDRGFNYEKMKKAVQFIMDGAKFVITNTDNVIPEGGLYVPHTGALAAGIEKATGVKPLVMGKPEIHTILAVQRKFGCKIEDCCIIGDRLDTDIEMGIKANIPSYLVMTGVTDEDALNKSSVKPTKVFKNLKDLKSFLKGEMALG